MTAPPSSTELAALRGEVMTELAKIAGDLRLVLEQVKHVALRLDEHAALIRVLDQRVDDIEQHRVTRAEMEQRLAELRQQVGQRLVELQQQMEERARRTLTVLALVMTALSIATNVVLALLLNTP